MKFLSFKTTFVGTVIVMWITLHFAPLSGMQQVMLLPAVAVLLYSWIRGMISLMGKL